MNDTAHPVKWTVDVEVLGRTVTVAVTHNTSPSIADVLNALDGDEKETFRSAQAASAAERAWASGFSTIRQVPHVCVDMCAGLGCCPGCGNACSHCLSYVVCITRDVGCVMPEAHEGGCVPSKEPRWDTHETISARAEPYRLAGIEHTITANNRNPHRYRLDFVHDRDVPSSGRWRRRLTLFNATEFGEWLGSALLSPADESGVIRMLDGHGQPVTVRPGDIADRSGSRWTVVSALS